MKKVCDLRLTAHDHLTPHHALLTLMGDNLPPMQPGQFVNIRIDNSSNTFLRRPISIHFYDNHHTLQLLVHDVGDGTHRLCHLPIGAVVNAILPLGRGFTLPNKPQRTLLVGGGVGIAPLLFLGSELRRRGCEVTFILGGKTANDILCQKAYEEIGNVAITTEDGSLGTQGFVTQHEVIQLAYDFIYTCGPKPMMQAVARIAQEAETPCEASLENTMACGIGACLCCVEKTTTGHRCVCTEGPVFNTQELNWGF